MSHNQNEPLSSELDFTLARVWSRFVQHINTVDAANQGQWNKVERLGALNSFLSGHYEVSREFHREYKELEGQLIKKAALEVETSIPTPESGNTGGAKAPSECWRLLLATYCRIHLRRTKDWVPWDDSDYREFIDAAKRLADQSSATVSAASS